LSKGGESAAKGRGTQLKDWRATSASGGEKKSFIFNVRKKTATPSRVGEEKKKLVKCFPAIHLKRKRVGRSNSSHLRAQFLRCCMKKEEGCGEKEGKKREKGVVFRAVLKGLIHLLKRKLLGGVA